MENVDQLDIVEERYEQLNELLSDPEVVSDSNLLRKYSKEQSELQKTVEVYRQYKQVKEDAEEIELMLAETDDADEVEMLKEEASALKAEVPELEEQLKLLLIPKDPNDEKDVIVEIRGAAGGDEAAIFAGDLFRMYSKFAESHRFKLEIVEATESDHGGYKEISFSVSGDGVYSKLKYENGAHRVQRVPETESGGRIHTSTATVAVLPEVEDVEIEIRNEDLKIDTYRSSGAGGQHVNTTDSAVRITHIPTGVIATSSEKSQIQNREKAMKVLKARLYDMKLQEEQQKYAAQRKSAVGTGDRSERIRTYNYPQSRVTDHRIGLTLQKLDQIMEGKLDEIVDALTMHEQTEKLKELNTGEL
ncbi:peptide chain release factor 1 [Staphylococcus pseudintermedius]|nr:peptide chain release factor 1 [Staphylococcus pseudintermedius]